MWPKCESFAKAQIFLVDSLRRAPNALLVNTASCSLLFCCLLMCTHTLHQLCNAALQVLESRIRPKWIKHRLRSNVGQHVRALTVGPLQTYQGLIVVTQPHINKCRVDRRDARAMG